MNTQSMEAVGSVFLDTNKGKNWPTKCEENYLYERNKSFDCCTTICHRLGSRNFTQADIEGFLLDPIFMARALQTQECVQGTLSGHYDDISDPANTRVCVQLSSYYWSPPRTEE